MSALARSRARSLFAVKIAYGALAGYALFVAAFIALSR